LTAPFFALVLTVLYFRLSAAKELATAPAPTEPEQQPPTQSLPDDAPRNPPT